MGLTESYEAYCFDEAVSSWGSFVEEELQKVDGDNVRQVERDRQRRLETLLELSETPGRFADPAALFD